MTAAVYAVVRKKAELGFVDVYKQVFKDLICEGEAKTWAWLGYDVIDCRSGHFVRVAQTPFNANLQEPDDDNDE